MSEPASPSEGFLGNLVAPVRTRIISGLILALPIVLTFWIVYWLYSTVKQIVLDPAIGAVRYLIFGRGVVDIPFPYNLISSLIAIIAVLLFLYGLGLFVNVRLQGAIDWVMYRLPLITTIYKALRNVFKSIDEQLRGGGSAQRVVLVEFPHPGAKVPAFVTNTLDDETTGRKILVVYVMTGVVPPAGFVLFVPETEVIETDWTANQALQFVLSGGMTSPEVVPYDRAAIS